MTYFLPYSQSGFEFHMIGLAIFSTEEVWDGLVRITPGHPFKTPIKAT